MESIAESALFAFGIFFDKVVVYCGVGGFDDGARYGFGDALGDVFPGGVLARGVEVAVGGTKGGTEGGAVGDFKLVNGAVLHIGHDLDDFGIDGGATGDIDGRGAHAHPFGVNAHGHHLGFDYGAAIACGIVFVEVEAVYAGVEDVGYDFGFEIGEQDFAFVAGWGGLEGL